MNPETIAEIIQLIAALSTVAQAMIAESRNNTSDQEKALLTDVLNRRASVDSQFKSLE